MLDQLFDLDFLTDPEVLVVVACVLGPTLLGLYWFRRTAERRRRARQAVQDRLRTTGC